MASPTVGFDVRVVVAEHPLIPDVRPMEAVVPLLRCIEQGVHSAVLANPFVAHEDAGPLGLNAGSVQSSKPGLAPHFTDWLAGDHLVSPFACGRL